MRTALEIAELDAKLAASQTEIELQLAQARLDLLQAQQGMIGATIDLYNATHPSEPPSPQSPTASSTP